MAEVKRVQVIVTLANERDLSAAITHVTRVIDGQEVKLWRTKLPNGEVISSAELGFVLRTLGARVKTL